MSETTYVRLIQASKLFSFFKDNRDYPETSH